MTPTEDPSLWQGSGTPAETAETITQEITNEDGSISTITVPQSSIKTCIHTPEYMAQPDIEAILAQQRSEMAAASAAAQAAAAQAAAAQPATEGEGAAQ